MRNGCFAFPPPFRASGREHSHNAPRAANAPAGQDRRVRTETTGASVTRCVVDARAWRGYRRPTSTRSRAAMVSQPPDLKFFKVVQGYLEEAARATDLPEHVAHILAQPKNELIV